MGDRLLATNACSDARVVEVIHDPASDPLIHVGRHASQRASLAWLILESFELGFGMPGTQARLADRLYNGFSAWENLLP